MPRPAVIPTSHRVTPNLSMPLVLALALIAGATTAGAATFTVNSTGDDTDSQPGDGTCFTGRFVQVGPVFAPECTLRAALMEANGLAGQDVVAFSRVLPTVAGVIEIRLQSPYPAIVDPVVIDGYSAAGYDLGNPNAKPLVNLGGNDIAGAANGLRLAEGADGSVVRGLAIHDFGSTGIRIESFAGSGPTDVHVEGCHIGIRRGSFYRGNGGHGISINRSNGARIGLRCDAEGCEGRRNVVASNDFDGIRVVDSVGVGIEGNFIGTDPSGSSLSVPFGGSTPNQGFGISILGSGRNFVGSTLQLAGGNLISGNQTGGVRVHGASNFIVGNKIGTRWTGTGALPNAGDGIDVGGSSNRIGSLTPGFGNVVSGNLGRGIVVDGAQQILGNTIGLSADHATAIGNSAHGLELLGSSALVEGNTIAGNGSANSDHGIQVTGNNHTIVSNHVGTNAIGDDLGSAGYGIQGLGIGNQIGEPDQGNVIGFHIDGVEIAYGALGNTVVGNWIGTDENGMPLGNGDGIEVAGGTNVIGGFDGLSNGRGNVIGANTGHGIHLRSQSGNTRILGNWIGTNAADEDLANAGSGILMAGVGNVVGGDAGDSPTTVDATANVVAYNGGAGAYVLYNASEQTLRGNVFYGHVEHIAIELPGAGPNPNDFGDTDTGGNRLQNTPEFDLAQTRVNPVNEDLEVRYRVNTNEGDASYPLVVDFYLIETEEGEADRYLGSDTYSAVSATLFRSVALDLIDPDLPIVGRLVATATDADGNTSELSTQLVPVPEPGLLPMLAVGSLFVSSLRPIRRCTNGWSAKPIA